MNNKNDYNIEHNLVGNSKLKGSVMDYGDYRKVYNCHCDDSGVYHDYPVRGHRIVAVQRDTNRRILAVKLEDGTCLSKDEAVRMAEGGEILDVIVGHSVYGEPYLRNVGDGELENNLQNLPEF